MKKLVLFVSVAAAVLLYGCQTNPETGAQELTNTGKALVAAAAGEFAQRYVAQSPDKAKTIKNIQVVAEKLANVTDAVTINDLRSRLDAEVAQLHITDLDYATYKRWIPVLQGLLQDYIGKDQLDGAAYIRVNEFLQIVVAALPIATTT